VCLISPGRFADSAAKQGIKLIPVVEHGDIGIPSDMLSIDENLRHAGSAIADRLHVIAQLGIVIDEYFLDLLVFFFQQSRCHDAVGAESGAVHLDIRHGRTL
jgi:hypothetical protein